MPAHALVCGVPAGPYPKVERPTVKREGSHAPCLGLPGEHCAPSLVADEEALRAKVGIAQIAVVSHGRPPGTTQG